MAALRALRFVWHLMLEDLRFRCADEEAAFKQSCEKYIICPLAFATTSVVVHLAAYFPAIYRQETLREDSPYMWNVSDPRTVFFIAAFGTMTLCFILAGLSVARLCTGRLTGLSWEHLATGVAVYIEIVLYGISAWHTARLFGKDPVVVWMHETESAEALTLLAQVAQVTAVCMYMPIRSHILWIVPVCAGLIYPLVVLTVGSTFTHPLTRFAPLVVTLCVMQYQGARRHERHTREKWLAIRRVERQNIELETAAALARALQAMAGTMSDTILMLNDDLEVMDVGDSYEAYFGKRVVHCKFSDLLVLEDRDRFDALLQEACRVQVMQSMPASLVLEFATLQVQLCMLDTRVKLPKLVVGLNTVGQVPVQEGVLRPAFLERVDEETVAPSIPSELSGAGRQPRLESLASTTNTGHVFTTVDNVQASQPRAIREVLQHIASIGLNEHWLISTHELTLLPSRVLGKGGFGIVLMACLRGTAVAAKLPKDVECVQNIRHFSSVINELRVHRHIRHSNIVLFYGACVDPTSNCVALIYELVRGQRLDVFVRQQIGPDDGVTRTKLLLDVAAALRYLHALSPSIVHGDVKTANILVESLVMCPRAKLLDLGLSRLLTKNAKPLGGTPRWMAPELLNPRCGRPKPMPSADVFSFGLVAYFVVTGEDTFDSIDREAAKRCINRRIESLPLRWSDATGLKGLCRDLCNDCLHFEPESRPDMADVQVQLLLWLPADPEFLQKLGPEVLTLILGGVSWEEGLAKLQQSGGCRPARSGEPLMTTGSSESDDDDEADADSEELQSSVSRQLRPSASSSPWASSSASHGPTPPSGHCIQL